MKFSNFGSIVNTYKKNFKIRKKKFIDERRATQAKKRKDREERIETSKSIEPLVKINGESVKKSFNFSGGIKKFLGLALGGFILNNLQTILPIVQEIVKKIEEIVKSAAEFVDGVKGGLENFFGGLDDAKDKLEDLISPIKNVDVSKFGIFQNKFDGLLTGILTIASIITGLYVSGAGKGKVGEDATAAASRNVAGASGRKAAFERVKRLRKAQLLARQQAGVSQAARQAGLQRLSEAVAAVGDEAPVKRFVKPRVAAIAGDIPLSPGAGIASGSKITPANKKLFLKNLRAMSPESPRTATSITRDAIEESFRRKQIEKALKDKAFMRRMGMDVGSLADDAMLDQVIGDFLTDPDKPKPVTPLDKLFRKPTESASLKTRFSKVLKNARGFITPTNLTKLGKFGRDVGIGVLIEFAASWLLDRGLEAIGLDEKSQLEKRVARFISLPKEEQRNIIERYNNELEKELNFQKSFFGKVGKVIALGDMTVNERKIKFLAGFLTAISVSGATGIYDLVSAGPLPDYLGGDVDVTLPSTAAKPVTGKISLPRGGIPALPPTGTGSRSMAAAQQYGAGRDDNRDGIVDRRHAGQDFDITGNEKFYSRIGGVVIYAGNTGGAGGTGTGYGNVVDIYNKELDVTERIAEAKTILPGVVVGARIKPGQAVVQGEDLTPSGSIRTGVIHYEIRKGKAGRSGSFAGTLNPLKFLEEVMRKSQLQSSVRNSSSSLISSAGLDQSTTYSNSGLAVRREVNNILIPIRSA
jgi:hypothetical protein|tara:strand:- start:1237 stop:3501 length:2265 start_codon:yes stop_codon:yes gene_type:complete